MLCSQCKKTNSPSHARFCVDCGYALRQPCPYNCGYMALPVQQEQPASQCRKCARFLAYCPVCLRLQPLGARACPTPRCSRDHVLPREPFAFHDGHAGGGPVQLQSDWQNEKPARLEPMAQSLSADHRCGGLASRYGKIVWWKEAKLHIWAAPIPGGFWPQGSPQTVEVIEPLFRGGIFPEREALLLAHGCAYMLGQNAVAKVALGQENVTRQILSLRANAAESGAVAASEPEFIYAISDDGAPLAVASSWQVHEAQWMAQTATADRWFGMGCVGETLVGASALGSSPLFEGERWDLPKGVNLKDWQELLAWDNTPILRCERAVWREKNGQWSKIFELSTDEISLDGALVCEPYLWIWGQEKGRLWAERLGAGETRDPNSRSRPSMPFATGDRLMAVPTACGNRITLFVSGSRNGAATLDISRPLDEVQFQQLPAAASVLWTAATARAPNQWLIYALDDGELVKFFLMQQNPIQTQPMQLMQFRPFRDAYDKSKGATLAATISGDCLVVSYIGSNGGVAGIWLMAHEWKG